MRALVSFLLILGVVHGINAQGLGGMGPGNITNGTTHDMSMPGTTSTVPSMMPGTTSTAPSMMPSTTSTVPSMMPDTTGTDTMPGGDTNK